MKGTKKKCPEKNTNVTKTNEFVPLKRDYLSKGNPNIPLEHTPNIPKPPNERNSCINWWLGVWGMLQGSVGKFLES